MWPIVLMGSGILAFVVLFGAGATFFLIRLATDAHIPTPGTTSHLAITGTSPLQQAVDNFLARSGKTVDWRPGGGLVQLGDAGDGHGPFITYWDTSLGVWPESTTGSGFTSDQLRKLPRKPPLFKTQTDRDEFRKALGKLSDGVKQAGNVAMKANELRAGIPPGINMPFQPEIWNQAAKQVDAMLGQWDVVDEFFNDQPLLVEYPLYRTELAGILPLPTQQQSTFNSFKHSLISYRDFTNFVFNVQNDTHKRYEEIGVSLRANLHRAV